MKISIITASKNSQKTIRKTLESVLSQTYADIEYIVIDGASSDGTLDIINEYKESISTIVSESDLGLYHALNRGISMATGDVIAFLHSDDQFTSKDTVAKIAAAFTASDAEVVYGNVLFKDGDKEVRRWKSSPFSRANLRKGWAPPHTAFFARKEMYDKHGDFNTKYQIAADYDIMVRFLSSAGTKAVYIDEFITEMQTGGLSNNSLKTLIKKISEDYIIAKENGLPAVYTVIMKRLSKVSQFF